MQTTAEDLIKSLVSSGLYTEDEAKELVIVKGEGGDKSEKEEDYSEDKEVELEKAAQAANELYTTYKSKRPVKKEDAPTKPTDTQKSENTDLVKAETNDIIKGLVSEIQTSFAGQLSEIQKSVESFNGLKSEIDVIKSQLENLGKNTPPAKSVQKLDDTILEKGVQNGFKGDNGSVTYSQKVHKTQIGEALSNLILETDGALQKSLDVDLMNYVAGGNSVLGEVAKRALKERKNIIVA